MAKNLNQLTVAGFHPDGRDCWVSTMASYKIVELEKGFPSRRAGLLGFYFEEGKDVEEIGFGFHPDGRDCWVSTQPARAARKAQDRFHPDGRDCWVSTGSSADREPFRCSGFHPDGRDCWVSTAYPSKGLFPARSSFHPDGRDCWVSTSEWGVDESEYVRNVSIPTGGIVGFLLTVFPFIGFPNLSKSFHPDGRDCWVSTLRRAVDMAREAGYDVSIPTGGIVGFLLRTDPCEPNWACVSIPTGGIVGFLPASRKERSSAS